MDRAEKREWLCRYQDALRKERLLKEEIEELRSRATQITQSLSGMPGGGHNHDKIPIAIERIEASQHRLNEQVAKSEQIREEIEMAIDAMTDEREKEVLQRKYIDGQKHETIAEAMNYDVRWIGELLKRGEHSLLVPAVAGL